MVYRSSNVLRPKIFHPKTSPLPKISSAEKFTGPEKISALGLRLSLQTAG